MRLENINVPVKEIYLDPYNPRFLNHENQNQSTILQRIFKTRDAKELLASMTLNIKWVNKIVVIKSDNFTEEQKKISDIGSAKYLVVEGNNRLACLKSGKISGYNDNSEIPVILAVKEPIESAADFEAQLRITQGIANVMVVKEWSVISKARHLYHMYKDILGRSEEGKLKPLDVYRRISQELGISVTEVRESVIRYEFFKTIESISDSIPEDHWGYLEAFDRTKEIREKFGMSSENNMFEIENDPEGLIEEILKDIPSLIKKASSEGINSKQFRDIIGSIFSEIKEREEIFEKISEIIKPDTDFNFRSYLDVKEVITEDEKWKKELDSILKTLGTFPPFAPWAIDSKENLEKITELIKQHLNAIK